MAEQVLPGGHVNPVVRVGRTVRRQTSTNSPYVHRLLLELEHRGWQGAPRYLGTDEDGREMLTYLDGVVPWQPPPPASVTAEPALVRTAELVREFHDLTAGTALAGGSEVVCHNDLSPKNTVYRRSGGVLSPVAFIDWDTAAPGERLQDLAHVCWQFLALGPAVQDVVLAGDRMRVLCDAYGLADRGGLVDAVLWWQDRCWRGIDRAAAGGDPAMQRLRDTGVSAGVHASFSWVQEHRQVLQGRL